MPRQNIPPIKPEQKKNPSPGIPAVNEEYSGGAKRQEYKNANQQRKSEQNRDTRTGESFSHKDESRRRASQADEEMVRPLNTSNNIFQQDDEDIEDDMDEDDRARDISP